MADSERDMMKEGERRGEGVGGRREKSDRCGGGGGGGGGG